LGVLRFGPAGDEVEIDDRALAHLQVVMIAKLRRAESFTFTWNGGRDSGEGRNTLWITASQYLRFRYYGSRVPALNRQWIEELMVAANSSAGLHLVPEPTAPQSIEQ
jgi:hypothetical protein